MARDPKGRLILFAAPHDAITIAYGARLAVALAAHGLKLEDRALFLPYVAHHQYLRVNQLCDVMLDTLHWSGGNTSLDAIACGLPVVTLPGRFMRGRQSAAMLGMTGVSDLVVADTAAYAEKAIALGADPQMRADVARRMREGHGELFARDEPIRALEEFLEKAA
jgi:predicted O-linked N-acetylglucosamine transferase (SPINDLY family)